MTYRYHTLLDKILLHGKPRQDRTGVGTISLFGERLKVDDVGDHFPIITSRKINMDWIVREILWFFRGDTNVKYLNEHGVKMWNHWADEDGDLGPIYGAQWMRWKGPNQRRINQVDKLIGDIKKTPDSRRLIISTWNVGELDLMKLPPCIPLIQFYVEESSFLHCQVYQRSADAMLGIPMDTPLYALLLMMIAQVCGLKPKSISHVFGDVHIYNNHREQAIMQLKREVRRPGARIDLNPEVKKVTDFKFEDVVLRGYKPHPAIKLPVSI